MVPVFNALAETGDSTAETGKHFDSISICVKAASGFRLGSLLIGNRDFYKNKPVKVRKCLGGMRQALAF